jgi:hypothetical protein
MFDVVAKASNISITSLEVDVSSGTAAQVWTKTGSHFGFETNVSSWTKIAGKIRGPFLLRTRRWHVSLFLIIRRSDCVGPIPFPNITLAQTSASAPPV